MHKQKTLLKIIALILIFNITACTNSTMPETKQQEKTNPEPRKLVIWHQWVNLNNSDVHPLKQSIQKWNSTHPDIQVIDYSWNTEQYKTKIKTALAAGDAPDIFYMWSGSFVGPFIDEGNILPLDSYLNDTVYERLTPGVINSCKYNGKIYSLPVHSLIASLYCNTELFLKANAKIPETYDELLEAVKRMREKRICPIIVGEKERWPGMYWYDILAMRQAGNTACLDALKDPSLFGSREYEAAADKLVELVGAQAFNIDALNTSANDMVSEYTLGNAAMMYQGNWVEPNIEGTNSKVKGKVVAVPFPTIQGGRGNMTEIYGGITDGFFINSDTQYKTEAVRVLEFISENTAKTGYLTGAGLSCWKMDESAMNQLSPLTRKTTQIMKSGTSFIAWWDTILPASEAEKHKDLVAELFGGRLTAKEFAQRMAKLKGTVP